MAPRCRTLQIVPEIIPEPGTRSLGRRSGRSSGRPSRIVIFRLPLIEMYNARVLLKAGGRILA